MSSVTGGKRMTAPGSFTCRLDEVFGGSGLARCGEYLMQHSHESTTFVLAQQMSAWSHATPSR